MESTMKTTDVGYVNRNQQKAVQPNKTAAGDA